MNEGFIARWQNFSGWIEEWPHQPKTTSFHISCFFVFFLWKQRKPLAKKRKCCSPRLYQFNPGKMQTKWSPTNPKSIMPPSTYDTPLKSVSKLITNSLTVEGLLVFESLQETKTPTELILLPGRGILKDHLAVGPIKNQWRTAPEGGETEKREERNKEKKKSTKQEKDEPKKKKRRSRSRRVSSRANVVPSLRLQQRLQTKFFAPSSSIFNYMCIVQRMRE